MVVNKTIQKLMTIGFSEYEARAYIALAAHNPLTAYELAKSASIPTSRIYQVIARLEEKGIFLVVEEGKRKRYLPLPPEELLAARKDSLDRTINALNDELTQLKRDREISLIWNFRDYPGFLDHAKRTIRKSRTSLLLSAWQEEFEALEPYLRPQQRRGVKVAVVHFGETASEFRPLFQHPIQDTLYAEKGGRGFALAADGREAVMATIAGDGAIEGAWSRNAGFVTLTEDYIKHDIYIMKIVERYESELTDRFGENYKRLRDVFSNEEEE